MTAKADAINTVFTGAKALIDADTNTVRHYANVPAWKKAQNMNSKAEFSAGPCSGWATVRFMRPSTPRA